MAVAYDGVLAAGHRMEEDISACPHTFTLLSALQKCTSTLSVAQLASGRLSIKSGNFRAFVPCDSAAVIATIAPDPLCGVLDNRLRDALEIVGPFIAENSQRVITASAYVNGPSVTATNTLYIIERWHGLDLPPNLLVPKLFINALVKVKKNLTGFGFSANSFTVYFEDDSWLKTQLYNDRWPDCAAVLNKPHTVSNLPEDFWEAFNAVFPFIEDGRIRIRDGFIASHEDDANGARYDVANLKGNTRLNAKHLRLMNGLIKSVDFNGESGIVHFYGDALRGALAQSKEYDNESI